MRCVENPGAGVAILGNQFKGKGLHALIVIETYEIP
jgi:hypothetical protein